MKWGIGFGVVLLIAVAGAFWTYEHKDNNVISPVINKILPRPLDKYTIEALGNRTFSSEIILDNAVATTSSYTSYIFHFDSDSKKVTGLAHIPNSCQKCPVIAQFHGYVDKKIYKPGVGTSRSAQVYAANGFISLAPDFLGLGGSDMPSIDVFEERLQTYTASLNLLAAIKTWNRSNGKIGVWGHSNGGQIAITIMEISKLPYPTVWWAPVSQSFPYSILYFTDEADDRGKALRQKLADFEMYYDTDLYSLTNYLDRLQAPIQMHQGLLDPSVPYKWNNELAAKLKNVKYYTYPGADHNLTPGWNLVVNRDIEFFKKSW